MDRSYGDGHFHSSGAAFAVVPGHHADRDEQLPPPSRLATDGCRFVEVAAPSAAVSTPSVLSGAIIAGCGLRRLLKKSRRDNEKHNGRQQRVKVVRKQTVREFSEEELQRVLASEPEAARVRLPKYMTASMLTAFYQCPKQFELQYVRKVAKSMSEELLRGLLVHAVLAELWSLPPADRTLQNAYRLVVPAFRTHVNRFMDRSPAWDLHGVHSLLASVRQLLTRYFVLEDPAVATVTPDVEMRLQVDLAEFAAEGELSGLIGRLDRLETSTCNNTKTLTIVDYKSGRSPLHRYKGKYLDGEWQIKLYALMLQRAGLVADKVLQGRLLYLGGRGKDVELDLTMKHLAEMYDDLLTLRERIIQAANENAFTARVSKGCKYCNVRDSCPAYCQEAKDEEAGEGVTIVRTPEDAARVLEILQSVPADRAHAVDTETDDWAPGVSPYLCGRIISWSIYCGPDIDFGNGPRLWIDNIDDDGQETGLLNLFKEYLESDKQRKVFHNYSFDRAMFIRAGINVGGFAADTMNMARLWDPDFPEGFSLKALSCHLLDSAWQKKTGYNQIVADVGFGAAVQLSPETRSKFIEYSALDAAATWQLHKTLEEELQKMENEEEGSHMLEFYNGVWAPFGQVLVELEERGFPCDGEYLKRQAAVARQDLAKAEESFRQWLRNEYATRWPEEPELADTAAKLNLTSRQQLGQLLFGFKGEVAELSKIRVRSLGLPVSMASETLSGQPQVNDMLLHSLSSGKSPAALPYIGAEGCEALHQLSEYLSIDKMLSTFLESLPDHIDDRGRIHSCLSIGTGTGRLSSRSPNLQQQPALSKDRYGVRTAYAAKAGCKLVVADYGQLEVRVLAHMTNNSIMIDALKHDCDLHSQTAAAMFDEVKEAVERGEVAIEAGDHNLPLVKEKFAAHRRNAKAVSFGIMYGLTKFGLSKQLDCTPEEAQATIDKWYASNPQVRVWQDKLKERTQRLARKGLSQSMVPMCHIPTLRGRWRRIYGYSEKAPPRSHRRLSTEYHAAERKVINGPIQGGSSDIVIEAMLKVHHDEALRKLGFFMVLQIHDELVLEGPEEHAEEALERLRELMEHPFLDGKELRVPLPVDACIVQNWGEAKG
eukprot:TRINITY_DN90289_c0_g1_i1.p1 TRINITY_DN90289_c0_g1~~TRINITY_DN90289_c0_g1_i1.p1  ORF type:complete len:1117 (-),score=248.73 TRINITY_DN90289_c0_g1_i1:158-3481(-)